MSTPFANESFPAPPEYLSHADVALQFVRVVRGEPSRGLVPFFHFRILAADEIDVGHINLRVGETEHVRVCVGHIGFEIEERHRGHNYAWKACRAISPFVRSICATVTLTCDSDSIASRRIIERLGARFIDEVSVPVHDPHFESGSRIKRRYRWTP